MGVSRPRNARHCAVFDGSSAKARVSAVGCSTTVGIELQPVRIDPLAAYGLDHRGDGVDIVRQAAEQVDVSGGAVGRGVERPAHVAKNRLGLPEELPLDFRIYGAFARGENPFAEAAPASAAPAAAPEAPTN